MSLSYDVQSLETSFIFFKEVDTLLTNSLKDMKAVVEKEGYLSKSRIIGCTGSFFLFFLLRELCSGRLLVK